MGSNKFLGVQTDSCRKWREQMQFAIGKICSAIGMLKYVKIVMHHAPIRHASHNNHHISCTNHYASSADLSCITTIITYHVPIIMHQAPICHASHTSHHDHVPIIMHHAPIYHVSYTNHRDHVPIIAYWVPIITHHVPVIMHHFLNNFIIFNFADKILNYHTSCTSYHASFPE